MERLEQTDVRNEFSNMFWGIRLFFEVLHRTCGRISESDTFVEEDTKCTEHYNEEISEQHIGRT